ncbi:MAG: peptide deformylase [Patescibacteria group bacterium]
MSTLLQVAELGTPVLRVKAKTVNDTKDPKIQKLIDDLIATVKEVDGVGIAAPQVYRSLRIFIVASRPNARYPNAPKMAPTAVINPKIISKSSKKEKDWEGCLSIPGIRGLVPRHTVIQVEYIDRKGKLVKRKFVNFIARIFQHELDHLDGIVFLDRLESWLDVITEKEYKKLIAKK